MWSLRLIFFHPVPQSERLLRESRLEEDPRQQPGRLQTQVVRNQVSRQLRKLQGRSALFSIRDLSPFPVGGRLLRVLTPLRHRSQVSSCCSRSPTMASSPPRSASCAACATTSASASRSTRASGSGEVSRLSRCLNLFSVAVLFAWSRCSK